jgi:hypothetical protein
MATFVILPPRELLEHTVNGFVETLLPGRPVPPRLWELLLADVADGPNVYSLHREDLPETDDVAAALVDGFGAEPGDHVVEYSLPRGRQAGPVRRWVVPGISAAAAGR